MSPFAQIIRCSSRTSWHGVRLPDAWKYTHLRQTRAHSVRTPVQKTEVKKAVIGTADEGTRGTAKQKNDDVAGVISV